jgi:polyhydroxyalkanoate synthesis regulator phasin
VSFSGANAQSLGDYARSVRKNKPDSAPASRHFDNDNLPTGEALSVVGPPPDAASASAPAAPDTSAADRQKAADDWKQRIDKQKERVAALNHEVDIDQRELRLRAAAQTSDPGVTARNVQFVKDEVQYKTDMDAKQKELEAARQQLDDLQDQAHKAGIAQTEAASDNDKNNDKSKDKEDKDKQ